MAHNIGQMFYAGDRPWHKLGTPLKQDATLEEALKAGGLDWMVDAVPMRTDESIPAPVSRRVALVRSDRKPGVAGRVVGVVHPGFVALQNREGMEILDHLLGGGNLYHTGGYLGDGEVVWLMAKLNTSIKVAENDLVEPYLLFSNSHDGSRPIDLRFTAVRVVCQNTLNLAMQGRHHEKIFRRAHKFGAMELERDAGVFLDKWLKVARQHETEFKRLASMEYDEEKMVALLASLFPEPAVPPPSATETTKRGYATRCAKIRATRSTILRLWQTGGRNSGTNQPQKNRWGALNAVTEFVDHEKALAPGHDRLADSMFGAGNDLKAKAWNTLRGWLV